MNLRRFFIEFTVGMIAYVAVLVGSVYIVSMWGVGKAWGTIIALLPMVPGIALALIVMRQVRSSDELQRRIQLEALSLAFAVTALVPFSSGFLENVGYPKLSMFFVWPLMATLWMVGVLISSRRFR